MLEQKEPVAYFNISDNLMSMHMEEREAMFKIFTENQELFKKLIPNSDLLNVLTDPTTELEHPLVMHFQQWTRDQLLPK
jgi:hypothetical protein